MQTPPPLPEPRTQTKPPPLPRLQSSPQQKQSPTGELDYRGYRLAKVWFTPVVLVGIPMGLVRQAWLEAANGDADARLFLLFVAIVGACGIVGLLGFALYLLRHPEKKLVGGLRRDIWFVLLPASWGLGVVIGVMWKHI